MRFLIVRLSALGDTVCTLPVAVALRRAHPECHITWAVDPRFAAVVERCSAVNEVVRVKPGFAPSSWPTYSEPFDVAFEMQGLLKSALAVARAKAKRTLGYHWQREGAAFFSQRVLPDPASAHVIDQYLDVVRAAGVPDGATEFGLRPRTEDLDGIRDRLPDRFVVMNAGAGWATKRWPTAHFGKLVDALASEGLPSVLIGGKADDDRRVADEVIGACQVKPISLVGETSIAQLIGVISLARAHVGGDTGSTHISAALGIPAVGLYSLTRPARSAPYGQADRCLYEPSGLADITPEAVRDKVVQALS